MTPRDAGRAFDTQSRGSPRSGNDRPLLGLGRSGCQVRRVRERVRPARRTAAAPIGSGARRARSATRRTPRSPSSPRGADRVRGGNSVTPDGHMNALNPKTPARWRSPRSPRLPGTAPPQNPTSTCTFLGRRARWAAPRAWSSRDAVERHVEDRRHAAAAAARVAVSNPSHSVRPGSLTCTWVSTSPGRTTRRRVDERNTRRHVVERRHALDAPVRDVDAGLARAVGRHTRRPRITTSAPCTTASWHAPERLR